MDSNNNRICVKKFIVPFHDLDPMQIMWHGNYLKYFDMTRSALFADAGVDLFGYFENSNARPLSLKPSTRLSWIFRSG
jgi:acyl-CoA thioesterase FadM